MFQWYPSSMVTKLLLAGSILHSLTYVSSSNIEEEHQTCYFLVTTFFCLNSVQTIIVFSQHYYRQKLLLATKSVRGLTSYLQDHLKHTETGICACGEISFEEVTHKEDCGICSGNCDTMKKRFNEIIKNDNGPSSEGFNNDEYTVTETAHDSTATSERQNESKGVTRKNVSKVDFPTGELLSSLLVLVILRFLRSLNQTGNKWLDRPDIGDWLNR